MFDLYCYTQFLFQISEGQIEWSPLNDNFDVIKIGSGKEMRTYPVCKGEEKWKASLKKAFPKEEHAINRFRIN